MSVPSQIRIAPWHQGLGGVTVAGSIFAIAAPDRMAAAAALASEGCGVHADIVIDGNGVHQGVTAMELERLHEAAAGVVIEVHVIVIGTLGHAGAIVIRQVLELAARQRVERIILSKKLIDQFADELASARSAGVALWIEITPDSAEPETDVDGALVLFITPGSAEVADARALESIPPLAARLPVGVDGGITAELALASIKAGASHIVSGRALVSAHPTQSLPEKLHIRPQKKGRP